MIDLKTDYLRMRGRLPFGRLDLPERHPCKAAGCPILLFEDKVYDWLEVQHGEDTPRRLVGFGRARAEADDPEPAWLRELLGWLAGHHAADGG